MCYPKLIQKISKRNEKMELYRFFSVHTLLLFVALTSVLKMSTSDEVLNSLPWRLLDTLDPKKSPLLISPSSIRDSLEVAYLGSAGDTSKEMRKSLQIVGTKSLIASKFKERKSHAVNAFYISNKLKFASEYKRALHKIDVRNKIIDFSLGKKAAQRIINWIGTKTGTNLKGIDALKPLINSRTSTIAVNAVNFTAEWEHPFEKKLRVGDAIIMRRFGNYSCGMLEDLSAKVVVLPLKKSKASMLILMPQVYENLEKLIERIKSYNMSSIDSRLKVNQVDVYFPMVEFNQGLLLNKALNKLNFKRPFSLKADFTQLLSGKKNKSYIRNVLQSTAFKVDLKGIDLSSATVVQWKSNPSTKNMISKVSKRMKISEPYAEVFYVNHPFIFAIREGNNILAIGGVSKPLRGI